CSRPRPAVSPGSLSARFCSAASAPTARCASSTSRWVFCSLRPSSCLSARRCYLPAEPIAHRLPHHQLPVAARQPRQLLGEQCHHLSVRARHARNVAAPEETLWPEGVESSLNERLDRRERIRLAGVTRRACRL